MVLACAPEPQPSVLSRLDRPSEVFLDRMMAKGAVTSATHPQCATKSFFRVIERIIIAILLISLSGCHVPWKQMYLVMLRKQQHNLKGGNQGEILAVLIIKVDFIAFEMFPHTAAFVIIFGVN